MSSGTCIHAYKRSLLILTFQLPGNVGLGLSEYSIRSEVPLEFILLDNDPTQSQPQKITWTYEFIYPLGTPPIHQRFLSHGTTASISVMQLHAGDGAKTWLKDITLCLGFINGRPIVGLGSSLEVLCRLVCPDCTQTPMGSPLPPPGSWEFEATESVDGFYMLVRRTFTYSPAAPESTQWHIIAKSAGQSGNWRTVEEVKDCVTCRPLTHFPSQAQPIHRVVDEARRIEG